MTSPPNHSDALLKVTCFVTRASRSTVAEVLLIEHPHAGIQYPAGTVEPGEEPTSEAAREAREETGLAELPAPHLIDVFEETIQRPAATTLSTTPVYLRPTLGSASWATLRNGIGVQIDREQDDFVQATYIEHNRWPDPQYISAQITGWVPRRAVTQRRRRFFYLLPFEGETPSEWMVAADHHMWRLFWAPVEALPQIVAPQDAWSQYLRFGLTNL